eukprot:7560502-Pyramimonas_sp.AAC.1
MRCTINGAVYVGRPTWAELPKCSSVRCRAAYVLQSMWCDLRGALSVAMPMWRNLCGASCVCNRRAHSKRSDVVQSTRYNLFRTIPPPMPLAVLIILIIAPSPPQAPPLLPPPPPQPVIPA